MLLFSLAEDQKIVEINKDIFDVGEDILEEALEGLRAILESHCKTFELE